MGRPVKPVDEGQVARLAFEGASDRMIGAILGLDHMNVARRFAPILAKKRAERRLGILRNQNKAMESGSVPMLIFLGKNELGQSDRVTYEVEEEIPKTLRITRQASTPCCNGYDQGSNGSA